jgi:hypothetical protein
MNQISSPERQRGTVIGPGRSGGAWDAGKALPVAGSALRQPDTLLFAAQTLPPAAEREPVSEATREKLRAAWRDPEIRKARVEKRRATMIERGITIRWEPNMDLALAIRLAAGHSRESIARHIGVAEMTVVNRGRFWGFIGT